MTGPFDWYYGQLLAQVARNPVMAEPPVYRTVERCEKCNHHWHGLPCSDSLVEDNLARRCACVTAWEEPDEEDAVPPLDGSY